MARKILSIIIFFLGIVFLSACGGYSEGNEYQLGQNGGSDSDFQVNFATAVNTKITLAPPNPSDSSDAAFKFKCNKKSCAYKCQLDANPWVSCKSPKTYTGLSEGNHTFKVKAKDKATGKWDQSPAIYSWEVVLNSVSWTQAGGGFSHSCGLRSDGRLYCFGANNYGQLGDGSGSSHNVPTLVNSDTDWSYMSAGGNHTCAVKSNRTLYCWGRNEYGQLGDGTTALSRFTPSLVSGDTGWAKVSVGGYHTCGIKTNNSLYCWGFGVYGQLGTGNNDNQNSPVLVGSDSWVQVAGGEYHTCAINTIGILHCMGFNADGQLGVGDNNNRNTPTAVGAGWIAITGGGGHSCGIKSEGTLFCWGENRWGQLGDGTTDYKNSPNQVGTDTDWEQVSAGEYFNCARKATGAIYCWGNNTWGQLATGNTDDYHSPHQVGSETNWQKIFTGSYVGCGLKSNGTLWCWGADGNGQVGNGTNTPLVTSPVQIEPN